MHLNPASKLIFRFLLHIVIGALLFAVVAGVATVLWYGTVLMREFHVPALICTVCEWVSELLFVLDVVCLTFFMSVEVWKLLRDVWGSLRERET